MQIRKSLLRKLYFYLSTWHSRYSPVPLYILKNSTYSRFQMCNYIGLSFPAMKIMSKYEFTRIPYNYYFAKHTEHILYFDDRASCNDSC